MFNGFNNYYTGNGNKAHVNKLSKRKGRHNSMPPGQSHFCLMEAPVPQRLSVKSEVQRNLKKSLKLGT
jgi:hypothetical protein